jgi:hypothetical protein
MISRLIIPRCRGRSWPGGLFVLTASAALWGAGCQEQRLAEDRINARLTAAGRTTRTWVASEERRPAELRRTGDTFVKDFQEDVRRFPPDLRQIGRYLDRDVRRWQANQPAYRRIAGEQLRGQPQHLEHTAVLLFL